MHQKNSIIEPTSVKGQVESSPLSNLFFGGQWSPTLLLQNGFSNFQSLQNGEAQPLHYQEFSLQNGFGANEPLKKRQALQNGRGQEGHFSGP